MFQVTAPNVLFYFFQTETVFNILLLIPQMAYAYQP